MVELLEMRAEQQADAVAYSFVSDSGEEQITYAQLDRRARAVGSMLAGQHMTSAPVLLLYPPGIDYIAAFFGCLYAGVIAVPAYPPDQAHPEDSQRALGAIGRDAMPRGVLTSESVGAALPQLSATVPGLSRLHVMVTDEICADQAWQPGSTPPESIALLQYTSGSTSAPRGVALTHRNLMSNSELIFRSFGHSAQSRGVIWLPPYHGMGLVGGIIQPLYGGFPVTLMRPADFLRHPLRWLQEISRTRATTSGGPNFAYDLCVRKTTEEERSRLDLSSWRVAFNGSEPVRGETMEKFAQAFESSGFRAEAFHPCYGLAEATLFVSGGISWSPGDTSRRVVPCGLVSPDRRVLIVDPDTCEERTAGDIGEIWISGDSAAQSYWHRPEETRANLGARLADTGEGPFVRSGDLGFADDHRLYVMGRIKDLIVIRGRHYHPQDIELTAEGSSPVLRRGRGAAFTVTEGGEDQLVVAYEVNRQLDDVDDVDDVDNADIDGIVTAIRAAVAAEHGVAVHTVVLVPPGGIPRTPNGKVQRRLTAASFVRGELAELGRGTLGRASAGGSACLDRRALLTAPADGRRDLLQEYLCRLIASACQIDHADMPDAPLLALGVDSCAMVSIQHSIRADLDVHLTATDLAQASSISDLAIRLNERVAMVAASSQPEAPVPAGQPWLLHESRPGSAEHSVAVALRMRGAPDISALEYAVDALVARLAPAEPAHLQGGVTPTQWIAGAEPREWLRESDAKDADDAHLAEYLEHAAREPFDLDRGPLLRIHLYRRAPEETILLVVTHHVIADPWSLTTFVRELELLYAEQTGGARAELPELTDFVRHYSWISGSRVSVHTALSPQTAAVPLEEVRYDRKL